MAGFHQTIIIGNVGSVDTRQVSGVTVCNFSVAVTEKWNNDGGQQEKTTWYKVAAWRKLGDVCSQYVTKGMQIMVSGNVEARGYTNNAGEVGASLELNARDVKFLSGGQRRDDNDNDGDYPSYDDDPDGYNQRSGNLGKRPRDGHIPF